MDDPCLSACGPDAFSLGFQHLGGIPAPLHGADLRQLHQFRAPVPVQHGAEHITAGEQIELPVRIELPQLFQGIHRIALAAPADLDVRNLKPRKSFRSQLCHAAAVFTVRQMVGVLVGRLIGGDQEHLFQPQLLLIGLCQAQVPVMDGAEGPPQNADLHCPFLLRLVCPSLSGHRPFSG